MFDRDEMEPGRAWALLRLAGIIVAVGALIAAVLLVGWVMLPARAPAAVRHAPAERAPELRVDPAE